MLKIGFVNFSTGYAQSNTFLPLVLLFSCMFADT